MKKMDNEKPRTAVTRLGRDPQAHYGFVSTPPYRGSTVVFNSVEELRAKKSAYQYGRLGTPTSESLHNAWAELSGAAGACSVPSGVAAITLALLSTLSAGDHILVTDAVYAPTRNICNIILKRLGVATTYYDPRADIAPLVKANTKVIFAESPSSLTMDMQDIPALAKIAHANDAMLIIDNTWATPLYFQPHAHGVDIAIEAGTKYLSGHSDILLGMLSANEKAWPRLKETHILLGLCCSADDQFLALRGLRTMALRLDHQGKTALNIATWLQGQKGVARVLHPALPGNDGHRIWKRDYKGASGVFAIELESAPSETLSVMLDTMQIFGMGYSWGGFESLVLPYDCAHRDNKSGTASGKNVLRLRLQIGLEDEDDLMADLGAALQRFNAARAA